MIKLFIEQYAQNLDLNLFEGVGQCTSWITVLLGNIAEFVAANQDSGQEQVQVVESSHEIA